MATENRQLDVDDEMIASRRAFWAGFIKFSTYVVVGVAVLLLLGTLILA